MMNFLNAMDREGSGFAFYQKFLLISMKKLKAITFDGPQIKELMKSLMFDEAELSVWQSLKSAVTNFLGNHRSAEYKEI